MTGTTERAVTAMRAIGDTVTSAAPLRLQPRPAASTRPARFTRLAGPASNAWRLWLVPAAAAVAVVAVAVSLALVRSAPRQPETLPGTKTSASQVPGASGSAGVPPYYVTLPAFGWYAYAPLTGQASSSNSQTVLSIGKTATGKPLATVLPPHGMTFNVVSGAADDRTFVVGATSYVPGEKTVSLLWTETWYLLRISPGKAHVAQLTRLSIPSVQYVTGVALSPDGTELAVAYEFYDNGPSGTPPTDLTVWSVATGKALRHWGASTGRIAASAQVAGSRPGPFDTSAMATALRWTPDGALAFAWNGGEIRLINFTSPASGNADLGKASRLWAGIGTSYSPDGASFTCNAVDGWSLSTGGKTFSCAGSYTPARTATGPGCGKTAPAHPGVFQQIRLGGGAQELNMLAQAPGCVPTGPRVKSASLGWSSADGSTVIAMLGDLAAGDDRFGVFTKKTFTALPALLANGSLATVAW
jgi:hypothetical protein